MTFASISEEYSKNGFFILRQVLPYEKIDRLLNNHLQVVNEIAKKSFFGPYDSELINFYEKNDEAEVEIYNKTQEMSALTDFSLQKEIEQAINVYNMNRPISHIPKIELVKGDLTKTAPKYLKENPHLVVSLLYLDVDLYEPTKIALQTFVPRMPKGAIIAFDELNAKIFPGETSAADEILGLKNIKIKRFPFDSYISYCILGF